jgi:hypothetical protein
MDIFKKVIKIVLISAIVLTAIITFLFLFDVMWKSPSFYKVETETKLNKPIMDMVEYEEIIAVHRRPYCYSIKSKSGGRVYVLGIEHTKDAVNSQFDTINRIWNEADPTTALVEGRMGFLFTWFQNLITEYGESGLTAELAKEKGIKLFTWEPTRDDEVKSLIKKYSAEQLAMFYSFRPYFSNMRFGKPHNPEEQLQSYLESRTDTEHLRGVVKSWQELNSLWNKDFPNINWRDFSDEYGWPEGYLSSIANESNLYRDYHLVQIINELVKKGERVFVTMGSSHAPRIESTLRDLLE